MFLFEYIIKLLMGNSNTLFAGLLVVIFSYYGWLLWNINDKTNNSIQEWEKQEENFNSLKAQITRLNEDVSRDLLDKLNDNLIYLRTIGSQLEAKELDISQLKNEIIAAVKEEHDETKELMKIMLGRNVRKPGNCDDDQNNISDKR